MSSTNTPRLEIPDDARIRPTFDSQEVKQNEKVLNFFPAYASKELYRNNYIQNPFPGNDTRRVAGISFDVNKQFIIDDPANGIDSAAIINGLKHAGILVTADQSHTQFLRAPIEEHSNFGQTERESAQASAYVDGGYVTESRATGIVKSSGMYKLKDPFDIAANQNLNLSVTFGDASAFPTAAQWAASDRNNGSLYLVATLYLAEIKSDS